MDYVTITGVKPYDGRYEFDVVNDELTTREWGWIKRHSGYLPLTIDEGLAGADPELFSIFGALALRRAGKIADREVTDVYERIADGPFGSTVRLELGKDEEEAEAGPPPQSSTGNDGSSGPDSTRSSEPSDETPPDSGTPASDTSALRPVRSAS